MKQLIISTNPWPFWIAVERNIASRHGGIVVDALNAFSLINRKAAYPGWRWSDRLAEVLDRKFERFVAPVLSGENITHKFNITVKPPPLCKSVDELRRYVHPVTGSRLGLAALSSAMSLSRIGLTERTLDFGRSLADAWRVAHFANDLASQLNETEYKEVYIFNGRHCFSRPFCDVLSGKVRLLRYEAGALPNSFILSDRSLHDPDSLAALIRSHQVDQNQRGLFFQERMERKVGNDAHKFTSEQVVDLLPEVVSRCDRDVVAFFNSSTDEYFAISETMKFGPFETQSQVALELAKICAKLGKLLVIRLHPNLKSADPSWRKEWEFDELRSLGACVLLPEDPVDSYALMRRSSVVVTCGSTMGVEAAYQGIPSVTVGRYLSTAVGATVEAKNADEMKNFVMNPVHHPAQCDAAIAYGSFFKVSGQEIYNINSLADGLCEKIDGRYVSRCRSILNAIHIK
jgi:hypothetical protein